MSAASFSPDPLSSYVRLDNVSYAFRDGKRKLPALSDVSFDVAEGDKLAVLGRSGAGKSTLLRCLNLLVRPDAGRVLVDGRELGLLPESALGVARRNIGMVFQHFALLHRRTVRENVALPLELAGVPRDERIERADALLRRVSLLDKADAWPSQLSGGQRQRAGIARALVHSPRVLLCDEATSALDPKTARQVVDLLGGLSSELGLTIVLVTHQLDVAQRLANRVAVLDKGRLREVTPAGEFFAEPRSAEGRRLLAPSASDGVDDPTDVLVQTKPIEPLPLLVAGDPAMTREATRELDGPTIRWR